MSAPAPTTVDLATVEALLQRLYIGATGEDGAALRLRKEDLKKAREVTALVNLLGRIGRRDLVVDAAAGHAYAGLCAAELLGLPRLVLLEREGRRADRSRLAATRLAAPHALSLEVRTGDVGDAALWPEAPDVVLSLHACGGATDSVIDRAIAAHARWILAVPCCHGNASAHLALATARVEALGLERYGELRRRLTRDLLDGERALRLEAAGYAVELFELVPPTVTPENLILRARWMGEPRRMADAAERRRRLLEI